MKMTWKRLAWFFVLGAILLPVDGIDWLSAQGTVHRNFTLQASAAQTAAGNGTGVDVTACLTPATGQGYVFVQAPVTAGSGTVTTFKVWLEVSGDGTNWSALPCWSTLTITGTAPTANTHLVINETAVQTSGSGSGFCSLPLGNVRARWNVAGTTPSETFSVILSCYS